MEAESKDVSSIQDEDVLRRMWQQTEDFGRKKEIRAHMYKLREARLKEFYTSGEVLKDVQRSNSSPGLRDQHSKNPQWQEGPTHADSLADHSFLSLKSKEIRDSESPTRDVQYRNSRNRAAGGDNGVWTISANTEKSDDGKRVTSSRIATTQGSRPIDGGELSYAATNEQLSSVYADGDVNNFTKCVGESSKTFAQQNVTVGDDKNYNSSKSTTSSSSSKVVSHHSSTTGNVDFDDFNNTIQDGGSTTTVTRKIYSSEVPSSNVVQDGRTTTTPDGVSTSTTVTKQMKPDIPDDLKKSIADGNTKVITETKTLPDGSTVTTTRYETKGSKKWSSTTGSTQVITNRQVVEQKNSSSTIDNKHIEYVGGDDRDNVKRTVVVTKTIHDSTNDKPGRQSYPEDYPDNINKTETVRIINSERNVYEDDVNRSNTVHVKRTQDVHDQRKIIRRTEDVTEQDRKVTHKPDTHDDQPRTNEIVKVTKIITRNDEDQFQPSQRKPVPGSEEIYTTVTTTKTTVKSGVSEKVDDKQVHHHTDVRKHEYIEKPDKARPVTYQPQDKEPLSSRPDNRQPASSSPRDQEPVGGRPDTREPVESRPYDRQPMETYPREPMGSRPQEREPAGKRSKEPMTSRPQDRQPMGSRPEDKEPAGSRPDNREPAGSRPQNRVEKYPVEPSSCRPQDKQPSRPQDIEFSRPTPKEDTPYKPSTPTDDQYTTTYRQEYVTKRITVDISPTHDAFARSLRAISPDRMSDRPKSRGSLRTSTSSLRSSTSPEKTPRYQPDDRKQPSRMSPERKPTFDSPRKRTESPRKHSPERATSPKKVTSPDRPRVSQSPDKKSPRTTGSPDRKPCTETVIRTTVTKTTTTGQPDKPYSTDTITRRKPDDRKSPEKQINSDTLPRKKTTPTQEYSPVRTPSPTKPSDRSSPSKTIPRNQASPERPSLVRGTSPTKLADGGSPVRSPTKPSNKSTPPGSPTKPTSTTEIITINTDTLTRKKKIPTSEEPEDDKIPSKPVDQSSPIRSPTKTTETLIMTKTGTITTKTDSPTDDSPGDHTKPDRDFPTKPTERIITETTTVTTERYPGSPSDTKVPKPKKPSSRDSSPTCSASDIEFINHNSHIVTDLDEPCDNLVPEKRPTSLDIDVTTTTTTTRKVKQVTDRSPSASVDSPRQKSPVKDSPRQKSPTKSTPISRSPVKESPTKEKTSPIKEVPKKNSIKKPTPEKDSPSERPPTHFLVSPDGETPVDVCVRPKSKEPKERPPLIRTETYEKRCRKILGLPDNSSPHKPNTDREPIEEPEFIKQQKQPDDEYAGREPVDEPLFVKKHFDVHCREDELIQENVERITKHRPRKDDQPDDEDYPVNREPKVDKETTEFITSERRDTDVKKYRQPTETEPEPVGKSNKDKPADLIKRTSERKPEPDTTEKKPVQKIPTLERKSPEKQKYPDTKQPQQKKPKDGQTDDGEYVTEYTDEYCERPISKKPEQKIPKDNLTKTTVTETTTLTTATDRKIGKKPVRDNSSPDRKYPDSKLRQPSKKQPKEGEPDDRDFTTEYIDEYCEVPTDRDGDIPRKPDQKIPKENVITTTKVDVTKVTEVTDKKLTRQIPSPVRKQPSKKSPDDKQKRPKKQKPEDETDEETDEELYTDEYNRTTEVITTEVTELEKPSDRKPIKDVRNKKPEDIENDKKPLRESPDRKSPKDAKPTEPRQKRPDDKDFNDEEYVDEYHRITKVTNIVNGRKPVDERPDRKLPKDSDTEMEPEDRNIPREPKDQKAPSSRITSTTTKTVKTITTTSDKKPVRESPSPDRKKPIQDKPRPNREQPDDVEEYNRITKVVTSVDRKIPVRQSPSPDRKQPKKLRPDGTEPVTEYTDEYCNKPTPKKTDKITSKTTVETSKVVTSTDKTTKSVTKKPGIDGPVLDRKQPVQDKKKPKEKPDDNDSDDREFTNEYIDEYSEVTTKETKTQKKPLPVDKYSEPDTKPKTSSPDRKSPVKDDKPSQKRPEVSRPSPSRDLPHKTTIITDLTDEYHITNRGVPESDKPCGRKPQTANFINNEKYDTDITLEIVEHTRDHPEREQKPVRQIPDVHYDIEKEVRQKEHIRTHRIDTTVTTDEVTRETSPRRYPQKAVPTDTMECTIRKPEDISDDENVAPNRKPSKPDSRKPSPDDEKVSRKPKKADTPEDRKTPVKQLKDTRKESLLKTVAQTKTTKVITKKISTPDVDTKRRVTDDSPKRKTPIDDTPKRRSPNDEKIPKEKSPVRQERPKQRSPSPVHRTSTKKVVETERVVTTQMTRKPSNKELPTRKTPDLRGKITDHPTKLTTSRTPSESPIRKPLYTSPAASPERKPTTAKPSPKVPHKESTQSKPTEPSKKHVVTKTISLNRKPDTKPQVSPVKSVPKTITTVKTTKITQPSSVTVTTVKTTKTSKKATKPKKIDTYSSDTESEPEIVDEMYDVDVITNKSKTTSVDKKKVITTAKINITSPNNVPKYQSPIRGKEPEITTPSYKVNASETITITTNKTTSEPVTVTTEQVTIMSQNKPLTKCITTKSIVLNKDEPIDQEIVIDLQRSTSSREPSPDKICPIPVSSEDETGYPRYPDEVSEPDDTPYRRKPQKISDIPLTEEEDVRDFNRITEVSERITRKPVTRISEIDKVTDTDESLLSVTEKVSRFITTAEKLTTDDQPKSKKPAPKVPRPELVVTDDLEDDECLLSVSDKVSKFITTAEHVSTKKHDRPQSPAHKPEPVHDVQVEEDDECLLSVNEKVTHFIEAAKTIKHKPTPKEPVSKVPRPEFTDIDETLKTDECLLSVSDKVSKFLTTAEKLTTTEVQISKMEPREKVPSRQPSPEKVSPDTSKLRQSPARKTPERNVKKSPNLESEPLCQEPTSKSPEITSKKTPKPVTGVKQSIRPVSEPTKITPSEPKPVNLKSSEAVRKAKAMFENINKSQEVPKQRDILSRPSVWEGRKKPDTKPTDQQPVDKSDIKLIDIGVYKKKEPITDVRKQLIYTSDEEEETSKRITTNLKDVTLKSTKLILNEKKSSTSEQVTTKPKYGSPERDTPGYMKPLGRHEHGSHEDIPSKFAQKPRYSSPERDTPSKLTQKPRHDSPDRDTPGYMRPIGTHRHPSHEDIPSKFSQKPRHGSPDRDMPSKLTQKPRHGSPDRDTPGYMRPLGKHEHPSHEDIPSKVAHKPRFSSPDRDSPTKSTYRPRHSSPEADMPGYMRPIGRHDSPRDDTPSKYTHKPRHSSPERDSYTRPVTKIGTTSHEEVTIDKKTVLRSKQTPDRDVPGYMRPISKVSQEDRNKYILETRSHHTLSPERGSPNYKKSVVEHEEYETETRTVQRHRYPDDDDMPGYMRPLNRCLTPDRDVHSHKKTVVKEEEIIVDQRHRHSTPERDVPGYMKPLQRHAPSPDRDSERIRDVPDSKRVPYRDDVTSPTNDDGPRAGKKFGVTLRRTDSGRMVTTTTSTVTERRRSSTPGQPAIEDIQDLDVLERMMDKVVGYEQRRRIRSQIRVVRRLISENKIQYTTHSLDRKKPTKQSSPVREPLDKERRSPSKDVKKITSQPAVKKAGSNHNNLPEDKVRYQHVQEKEERKTEYKSSYTRDELTSERVTAKDRSMSPEPKKKPQTTPGVYKTDLKPVQPVSKVVSDDKPSWVTNRNLKKTVTETATEERRNNVPLKKKETPRRSPSPQKEVKPIDCITSSYGIGPTDENGQPLFGIRALRKAATTDKVQVRGTVVTSQFYSENGKEPVGEVTVTKYSNNPKELEIDDEQISKAKGFASVTTTQKFGTRGAPTLKSVIDNKKAITDKQSEEEEIFKTTTTKVTRRGSVKALSQKFIENAVEISRNERQTYPKAGLILRTSSFKETAPSDRSSSRESSPGYQGRPASGKISLESITSDSRNNSTSSATTQHTDETKTFLNSHTRVANAQEVITRMKNAEREERDDDSPEDKEARILLNKFLGAQVLMSGMEPLLTNKTASTTTASAQLVRKVQKTKTITSSSKDSGNTKPSISLTKRFQCPITPEVLEDIWDEQTLRLLLEQCTDYEERRHIRARLRQVMAEQEAVANVVASAVAERDGDADRTAGSLQGESLLLPLLQELLDKKGGQQHQQQQGLMNRSASSQSSEESATATVDSGTESGEDLRLLAVGLCDTMDSSRSAGVEPLGPGLLAEVQNALSRLAVSLQLESADVQMEPGKRQSLLQLVARLQANLVVPTKPPTERRPSGSHGRFAKHKNRQNRHTVGVSSEELAAARKLMEEVVLRDSLSSSVTPEYVPTPPDYTLQKQNSDGCVSSSSNQSQYRSVNFSPQATTPVKNATAKPFTFAGKSTPDTNYNSQQPSQPPVGFNKSVSEPSTPHDHNQSNPIVYREKNHGRQSLNLENVPNPYMSASESVRPVSECFTMDHNTPNVNTWSSLESVPTQKANVPKHNVYAKQPEFPKEIQESETDDDSSTVKQSEDTDDNRQSVGPTPTQLHYVTDVKTVTRTITPVQDSVNNVSNSSISSRNSDYDLAREKEDLFNGKDLSAAQRLLNIAINDDSKTGNRFNTKKLKMKRANTIDIPKPLNFYVDDDDSDDSILDRDDQASTRRSNYLALRGPIRVGQGVKSNVPSFEPKTENDKKFMAFIQKHNNNNTNITSLWSNKNAEPKKSAVADQNWNRKFGNIKTVFEKEEDKSRPSSTTVSSAKQFWQSADDAVNAGRRSYNGPKVSKQGTRQLQSLFEQKQQESKLPWTQTEHNNVVTGTLKVESNFKPIQNNQLIQGKNYKFVPQPLPVNKFSHAPMSAFKPPPKRTPVANSVPINQSWVYPTNTGVTKQPVSKDENAKKPDPETPLFLYTPKQLEFLQSTEPEEETKPTSGAPWASGPGQQSEHRVLSLAASKFENPTSREVSPQPHRKPSKDKVYIPPILLNNTVDTYNQPLKQSYQPEHIASKDLSSPYLVKNVQPTKHQVRKISGEYDHVPQTKIDINSGFRTPNQQIYKSSSDESNNSYVSKNDNIDPRDPVLQTVKQTVKKFSEDNKNDVKVIHKQHTEPGRGEHEEHMKVQMMNKTDHSYKQPSRRMSAEYERPIVADVHVVQQQSYQNPPQDYQQIPQNYQSPPQDYQKVAQNYQSPPEDYQKIAQSYQSQSNDYQNAPQYYQAQYQTPDYQKLSQNYQDQSQNYVNAPQTYQNLPQTYQSQTTSQKLNSTSTKPVTFEYPSSESSQSTAVTPDNLDEPDINPFTEYKAVSKVMTGPVSQQAVTVTQKTPKRREDHDNAARNLQNVLKNISRSEDREEGSSRRSSRPSLSPNPSMSYKNKSQSVTPTMENNQTNYQAQSNMSQSQYANENNLKPKIPERKISREERAISPNYTSQTQYEQKPNYASQVQYTNKQYEPETAPPAFVPVNESAKVNIPNYGSQVQYSNKQYEQQTTPSAFKPVVKDTTYSSENTKMNTPNYSSQYSNKQYEQRDTSAFKPVNEKSYQTENSKVGINKSNISSQSQYSNKQYEMESSKQKSEKVSVDARSYPSQTHQGRRQHERDTSQNVPSIQVNAKPFSMESLEINDDGESVVTTKLQIPVHSRIVQYNNTTNAQRTKEQVDTSNKLTAQSQPLSRSDSWQKLTTEQQQITAKPSPRASPKARNILQKAKSSHSLAVPKQFEAGISRDEVEHKKKTVAAYFGVSQPLSKTSSSGNIHSREERTKIQQSSINRTKTGHKMSTQSRSSGLARSRTMSDVADMSESAVDIDEEFENIFQRIETTKKTFSEGPVTTTQVSSTRVISSSRQVNKPISPFAKFRQLDKQNSLNSPPSSPRTPGGGSGAPLFKFTDPALSHSASTVKDRLLHWCQMKTKEYQNIKLENFSTCWADGLAFCALIHHFLPDAFDYHALTPQQRRHNFTLAFKVADEQAGIAPLLDVDDMVAMRRPDWKCVFTYVQSIYRRFKDED